MIVRGLLSLIVVSSLLACGAPYRFVRQSQDGGIVAVRDQENKEVRQTILLEMRKVCQGEFDITDEGEVVIGSETRRTERVRSSQVGGRRSGVSVGVGVSQTVTTPVTEWQIDFTCRRSSVPPATGTSP